MTDTAIVAIQGGPHSFSDLALDRLLARRGLAGGERLYLASFAAAVEAVAGGQATAAFLPIENTLAGSLNQVYRLMHEHDLRIQEEQLLPVVHCLAALPGARPEGLRRVLSHAVALQQCQRLLASLADCTAESRADTARAAEAVAASGRRDLAAICSEPCARTLGLEILRRDVADSRRNATRFVLLGREAAPEQATLPGRTSLLLTVDDRHGALARCLEAFARRELNLSKLESRRRPGEPAEYLFYLDVDAWAGTAAMAEALAEVRGATRDIRVLGSYARHDGEARAAEA